MAAQRSNADADKAQKPAPVADRDNEPAHASGLAHEEPGVAHAETDTTGAETDATVLLRHRDDAHHAPVAHVRADQTGDHPDRSADGDAPGYADRDLASHSPDSHGHTDRGRASYGHSTSRHRDLADAVAHGNAEARAATQGLTPDEASKRSIPGSADADSRLQPASLRSDALSAYPPHADAYASFVSVKRQQR